MIKKSYIYLVILLILGSSELFALRAYDTKSEIGFNMLKKAAIGIEGGLGYYYYYNPSSSVLHSNLAPLTGRVGLSIENGKLHGSLSKYTHENSLGYIFLPGLGHGFYFHTTLHHNIPLGRQSDNYFYTGYGIGVDSYLFTQDSRLDIDIQAVRIPFGFKFIGKNTTEFFLEVNIALGVRLASDAVSSGAYLGASGAFKSGLRFWF